MRKAHLDSNTIEVGFSKPVKRLAYWLFVFGTVGSELIYSLLLQLTLGDAGLLEEGAATQFLQNAGALEFLLEALQRTVNGFVVFDLNDNHIEG
jgi:hypothetical protein